MSQNFVSILGPFTYNAVHNLSWSKICNKFLIIDLHKLLFIIYIETCNVTMCYFILSLHYRRSLLAQLAGAFHHLGVKVVPNPMTLLEDISGEDIFQSRTVLVKPTLSALYRASGPSSRGKPLRRTTYLIDLPFPYHCFAFAQVFAPERQGKTRDSTKGKSQGKTRLKAVGVLAFFPLKNSSKKIRVI